MKVLVGYSSRHGATAGIAERIAVGLREAELDAEAHPIAQVEDVDGYGAFVIGAAAYMFHWLKDATKFVKRYHQLLGLGERLVRRMPASPDIPAGDFRDWAAIDAWAGDIARELLAAETTAPRGG